MGTRQVSVLDGRLAVLPVGGSVFGCNRVGFSCGCVFVRGYPSQFLQRETKSKGNHTILGVPPVAWLLLGTHFTRLLLVV